MEENLALYKKTYPENHSSIAWSLTHLGNIYHKLGNYEKAKHLLEQSHYIYKTYFNENHIANAWVLTHLSKTYQALGDHEKDKAAFEKGYGIYKAHNVSVAWPTAHLGNFYREKGQYDKENEFLNRSFTSYLTTGQFLDSELNCGGQGAGAAVQVKRKPHFLTEPKASLKNRIPV